MPVLPSDSVTPPDEPADGGSDFSSTEQRNEAPNDPIEMAEQRKHSVKGGDVTVEPDGSVDQKPHGNMDETLVAKGKDHPEQGPYVPEHDHIDPDLEPVKDSARPHPKDDLEA